MKILKIKKIIKNNYQYLLFFFFSLFIVLFVIYNELSFDATWEFGMSHAIRNGLLPYKDINTVVPPFFIYLFSIGLFIKDSFATFLIEFCIAYTIMYYFLRKMLNNNSILIIISMSLFLFNGFIPSYNTMSLVLMVILLYLEKENKSDKLIGFILGLLILTKHTIGIPVFFLHSQELETGIK